jgi:hypothetical protein
MTEDAEIIRLNIRQDLLEVRSQHGRNAPAPSRAARQSRGATCPGQRRAIVPKWLRTMYLIEY